ncbi:hypothetical protein C8J57DRAFT_1480216 [Mycena rebaudengoi]|nr:hypothetical protein C8J57DRAFT_1480216 [Mycena rebaudengoi]
MPSALPPFPHPLCFAVLPQVVAGATDNSNVPGKAAHLETVNNGSFVSINNSFVLILSLFLACNFEFVSLTGATAKIMVNNAWLSLKPRWMDIFTGSLLDGHGEKQAAKVECRLLNEFMAQLGHDVGIKTEQLRSEKQKGKAMAGLMERGGKAVWEHTAPGGGRVLGTIEALIAPPAEAEPDVPESILGLGRDDVDELHKQIGGPPRSSRALPVAVLIFCVTYLGIPPGPMRLA